MCWRVFMNAETFHADCLSSCSIFDLKIKRSSVRLQLLERDRVETGQWFNSSRHFQPDLIELPWLLLTPSPVQLSLTFRDRKLERKIHVGWYRLEQIWTSFTQRRFILLTPDHHFAEPLQSGSGRFTVGKTAVWINNMYFCAWLDFSIIMAQRSHVTQSCTDIEKWVKSLLLSL